MVQQLQNFTTKLWSHVQRGGYRDYAVHQIIVDYPSDNSHHFGPLAVAAS